MEVYKDSKRNTWYFRIYIENEFGIKKQICRSGFQTKTEAKFEEQKISKEYINIRADITFQELYDDFIKYKKQNLKPQSIRATISRYKNHILPYFKDYRIDKIDHIIYINWKEEILKRKYTFKYNSNLHGCMVAILNYAMNFYNLERNIASKVGNFSKKEYIRKVDFWTYDEYLQFINVVDNIVYNTLYRTLYFTGMRLGECLALTWKDIQNDCISVNKTLAKGKFNNEYVITTPKTKSSIRKIKLDDNTIIQINNLRDHYKDYINYNDNWFVFGGLCSLSQTTVGRKKDEYCKLANVKRIKIHDFRHSHATFLLSKGIPVTVISKRLGHSDMSMTLNIYSHLIPEDENKAIDLINNLEQKNNN